MMPRPTCADKAWAYIAAEYPKRGVVPAAEEIARVALGRKGERAGAYFELVTLLSRGLLTRTYSRKGGTSIAWGLTEYGHYEIRRAAEAAAQAAKKPRKPRRTGSPKRVPHKPTAEHKKPTRRQRRESERKRENQTQVRSL
jgi:hypothetical protein